MYELNRSKFYRNLEKIEIKDSKTISVQMKEFWEKVLENKCHASEFEILENSDKEIEETDCMNFLMNDDVILK